MRLALFQPDIPQNAGTIIRLCACFDVPLDIIEPCGFVISDSRLRRAHMDYQQRAIINRHKSWTDFETKNAPNRMVLLTTKGSKNLNEFDFSSIDTLIMGSESSGVPDTIHQKISHKIRVPINPNTRSLNVAVCASMVLWEALRQTKSLPNQPSKG
jgi:tRNA (cytidine/uridine-2'-O-)-methyltransferase